LPSKKLITRCPEALLISLSAIGIGYSSLGVALFKLRIYTYLNFANVLVLHGYDVENSLRVSARLNESHIK
jgi:hypothetical protein